MMFWLKINYWGMINNNENIFDFSSREAFEKRILEITSIQENCEHINKFQFNGETMCHDCLKIIKSEKNEKEN